MTCGLESLCVTWPTREFVLFEEEAARYIPGNYRWAENNRGNFEGFEITTDTRCFTWQPHGSQFTIHRIVPAAALKFRISANIPIVPFEDVLRFAGYQDNWIEFES